MQSEAVSYILVLLLASQMSLYGSLIRFKYEVWLGWNCLYFENTGLC